MRGPNSMTKRWARIWLLACLALAIVAGPFTPVEAAEATAIRVGKGGLAYLPASVPRDRPAPLLILLHGARGGPRGILVDFLEEAERRGIVLVAPASSGRTWDVILDRRLGSSGNFPGSGVSPSIDPPRIAAAVEDLARQTAIDRSRIGLAGFSDGASYALTVGTGKKLPFEIGSIIAFSPGMALLPAQLNGRKRIFISHGRQDRVLPYDNAESNIAPTLRFRKQAVTFRSFQGGHQMPDDVKREALDWMFGPPAAAAASAAGTGR